jgi:hypothetical protein
VPYALGWAGDAQRDDQGGGCPFMQAVCWEPCAPGAGDQRTLATATTVPARVTRAGNAQPGGHGRSPPRVAYRAGGPRLDDQKCLVDHCGQVDDGNRYSQAEMLATITRVRTVTTISQTSNARQSRNISCHWLASTWSSWHVVLVHALRAAWVRVGVCACSSMTATRRSKTGSASVSTCRSWVFKAAMADCSSAAFVARH